MSQVSGLRYRCVVAAGAALLLFGCGGGGKKVTVEGKIFKNGTPLAAQPGEILSLSFVGADSKTFPATVSNDGSFTAKDVVPGKYKVQVSVTSGANDPAAMAKLKDAKKQLDTASEKLEYEVTGDATQNISVDVGKATVAKQ